VGLDPFFWFMDLAGVFVFGISGAIAAERKAMDVYGSFTLAIVTALGGGMIRDVLLGRTPAAAFGDPLYLGIASLGGLSALVFSGQLSRLHFSLRYMDALGLGIFTVLGTTISLDQGISLPGAILLGILSGTGGGMLRDVLSQEVPLVLQKEIYAVAALVGAGLNGGLLALGVSVNVSAGVGAGVIFLLRILSLRFDWHLPRAGK